MIDALETAQLRKRCLELALDNAANGARFDAILATAKKFEDFVLRGEVPGAKD